MDNYSNLVSKVLTNDHLSKALRDIVDKDALNLVAPDWIERLENNAIYQDYTSRSKKLWIPAFANEIYEYEHSQHKEFPVVLVSHCKFYKTYTKSVNKPNLIVLNSEPLSKIARAMTVDLGSQVRVSSDFKFNFIECSFLTCYDCIDYANEMSERGHKITRTSQPCIQDTRVFNGKEIFNCFHSVIQEQFPPVFLAILRLNIHVRYNVKDSNNEKVYRINGEITDFLGFNERRLESSKRVKVGPLVGINFEEPSSDAISKDKASKILKETENDVLDSFIDEQKKENDKYDDLESASEVGKKRKLEEDLEYETEQFFLLNDD